MSSLPEGSAHLAEYHELLLREEGRLRRLLTLASGPLRLKLQGQLFAVEERRHRIEASLAKESRRSAG